VLEVVVVEEEEKEVVEKGFVRTGGVGWLNAAIGSSLL